MKENDKETKFVTDEHIASCNKLHTLGPIILGIGAIICYELNKIDAKFCNERGKVL